MLAFAGLTSRGEGGKNTNPTKSAWAAIAASRLSGVEIPQILIEGGGTFKSNYLKDDTKFGKAVSMKTFVDKIREGSSGELTLAVFFAAIMLFAAGIMIGRAFGSAF